MCNTLFFLPEFPIFCVFSLATVRSCARTGIPAQPPKQWEAESCWADKETAEVAACTPLTQGMISSSVLLMSLSFILFFFYGLFLVMLQKNVNISDMFMTFLFLKLLHSEIQILKKSVSSLPPATLELCSSSSSSKPCSTNPPSVVCGFFTYVYKLYKQMSVYYSHFWLFFSCSQPSLDNGQYLDIRGVSEAGNDLVSTSTQNTSQSQQQTCNKTTSQQRVQFDQPNRLVEISGNITSMSPCHP